MPLIRTTFLLFCVFWTTTSVAQHPELLNRTWYLDRVVIDSQPFYPPVNEELEFVTLHFSESNQMESIVCDVMVTDIVYEGSDQFTLDNVGFTLGGCFLNENSIFQEVYFFEIFIEPISDIPFNPFQYSIIDHGNGQMSLIVFNNLGNEAHYTNIALGINRNPSPLININPNPTKDLVFLSLPNDVKVVSIVLCDASGRVVMNPTLDTNHIDLSTAKPGIYLLKITTDIGYWIGKVVKE